MIQIHIAGTCDCCSGKVCKRCGGCHKVECDDQVRLCRSGKDEKYTGRHTHKSLRGVRRRLKGRMRTA